MRGESIGEKKRKKKKRKLDVFYVCLVERLYDFFWYFILVVEINRLFYIFIICVRKNCNFFVCRFYFSVVMYIFIFSN